MRGTSVALAVAVIASGCSGPTTAPTVPSATRAASPSVSELPSLTPSARSTVSPGTRVFVGAGLETFAVGTLKGEIALVVKPTNAKGTSPNYRELWAVSLDGGPATLAARYRAVYDRRVADSNLIARQMSPDGRRIVLDVAVGESEILHALEVIELETGSVTLLLPGARANDRTPAWSPDGRLIAFTRRPQPLDSSSGEIWVVGADGQNARRVRALSGPGGYIYLYGWLADSRRIAFDPVGFETSEIATVDLNGVESARVSGVSSWRGIALRDRRPTFAGSFFDSPRSPTKYEVLVADDIGAPMRSVARVDVKPNDNTVYGLADPRWAPASDTIAYRTLGTEAQASVVELGGGLPRTFGGRVKLVEWSADGKRIVTVEEHPSTAPDTLYVYGLDGKLIREQIAVPAPDEGMYQTGRLIDLAVRSY